ncbi:YcnI family copper-binding membrane protein [Catelliglobosispora koreensis]|uniref:YcnI family copper-binding membrane protein n=1 Tax=Catelliglobosispora koreensis TaxID=129052 RepID=UPI00037D927C|nr:YcnI family protein [Catelliglobosispora koreensis]
MKKFAVVAAATIALVAVAAPASAHVTVNPKEATQGGYARVAFRVPNESDTESTTKLEIQIPEDTPVASVSTMPVPGWTVTTTKRTLSTPLQVHGSPVTEVVGTITWTATPGAEVKPGQFQEFPVSMGPMPKADQMIFKALQTYSDGAVVRWIDLPSKDGSEVEHPAPVLKLVAAANPSATPAANVDVSLGEKENNTLGWAGLAAGVLALIVAGFALSRTRRS